MDRARSVVVFASCLLGIGAIAAGCAKNDATTGAANGEAEIQGGKRTRGYDAVGVVHQSVAQSFCTGTLIAPDIVLTAGHCIEGDEIVDAFFTGDGKATTDDSADPASLGMKRHAVAEQLRYPTFDYFYTCPNPALDVALLRLAEPITDITPVELGDAPVIGSNCQAVGFGTHETDGAATTYLEKRVATINVIDVRETSFDVRAVTGIAAHGDSGGPMLCSGKLVGTTSCQPDWPPDAVSYGNVSSGLIWIRERMTRWDSSPTDGDAGGASDDRDR